MIKFLLFFIISLASLRGVFIYYLGFNPNTTYIASSVLLFGFGLISFINIFKYGGNDLLSKLKKYIYYLYFIGWFYFITTSIFQNEIAFGMLYSFAIFPLIFLLIRYDNKFLEQIIFIITVVTLFGVLNFYLIGLTNDGYYELLSIRERLRPSSNSISSIGIFTLSFGFQGSHHDAANILVMGFTFYISKATKSYNVKQFMYFIFAIIVLFVLFLTGSASNILIALVVSSIYLFIWAKERTTNILLVSLFIIFSIFFFEKIEAITFFKEKFINQDIHENGGIFNALNFNSVLNSLHSILFGYGYVFNVPLKYSELAFVKRLISFGVFPFLLIMFILLSPFYYLSIFKKRVLLKASKLVSSDTSSNANIILSNNTRIQQLFYSTLPFLGGTLTLLHYGSLFRITSIGLFCVLLALFYKEYISFSYSLENEKN